MTSRIQRFQTLWGMLFCFSCMASIAVANNVPWRSNLNAAKLEAAQSGKLVLIHFWKPSCGPCRILEQDVFSQPSVAAVMQQHFVPVKVNTDESPALAEAFRITSLPSEIVLSPQGQPLRKVNCPLKAEEYQSQLASLAQLGQQGTNTPAHQPVLAAYAGLNLEQQQQSNYPTPQPQNTPQAGSPQQRAAPAPSMTSNPYATNATSTAAPKTEPAVAAPPQSPYGKTRPAAQQTAAAQTPNPPSLPSNAMPSSYRPQQYQAQQASGATARYEQPGPSVQAPPSGYTANNTPPVATQPQQVDLMHSQSATASVATPSANNNQPKLPPGSPPLAFDGFSPVALNKSRKWVAGDPQIGAVHRGRTYLFTSEEERQQFFADPDKYSPVFSGLDPVKLLEENQEVEGSRQFGFKYLGAFYLFSSQESMNRFAENPNKYAAGVKQAMQQVEAGSAGRIVR